MHIDVITDNIKSFSSENVKKGVNEFKKDKYIRVHDDSLHFYLLKKK